MKPVYDMDKMLAYSRGIREQTDLATIAAMIDGCISVTKTDEYMDRQGVDYVATLRNGGEILIDAKTRTAGCSRYWKQGPELALEFWSVIPDAGNKGKTGWTLCENKQVDYILFTFDETDTNQVFLYPFQLLRIAFRRNAFDWRRTYKVDVQSSGKWKSQCVFVPEDIVFGEMRKAMIGQILNCRPIHTMSTQAKSPAPA